MLRRRVSSGRFTQEDPIGLSGGLNLYGFAAGDPINNSDPFGDTTWVGCRPLEAPKSPFGDHCAIMVGANDTRRAFELNRVHIRGATDKVWVKELSPQDAREFLWAPVTVPQGVTSEQFDSKMLQTIREMGISWHGRPYTNALSNVFVYQAVTAAGGRIPCAAIPRRKFDIFGAFRLLQGHGCQVTGQER